MPRTIKIRLGVHKCLGSKMPMLCPERNNFRLGFHKCLGSKRPMLCPERHKIRLGFHNCLGSRRPMLRPEWNETRQVFHKCLGPQGGPCCAQDGMKNAKAFTSVSILKRAHVVFHIMSSLSRLAWLLRAPSTHATNTGRATGSLSPSWKCTQWPVHFLLTNYCPLLT